MNRADRFFDAVDREQAVQEIVAKCEKVALREPRRGRGQTQVLADVSAVDQRVAVAAIRVTPRVAPEHVGEQDRRGRAFDRRGPLDRVRQARRLEPRRDFDETVLRDLVVVDARREALHARGCDVDLARVERARRGRGAPGRPLPAGWSLQRDAVGEVEQPAELRERNRASAAKARRGRPLPHDLRERARGLIDELGKRDAPLARVALVVGRRTAQPRPARAERTESRVARRLVDVETLGRGLRGGDLPREQRCGAGQQAEETASIGSHGFAKLRIGLFER